jgi:hypothetical protein
MSVDGDDGEGRGLLLVGGVQGCGMGLGRTMMDNCKTQNENEQRKKSVWSNNNSREGEDRLTWRNGFWFRRVRRDLRDKGVE